MELTTLVSDYRREHGIEEVSPPEPVAVTRPKKQDTKRVTLQAFKQGQTIPRIAAQRSLVVSTIEGHMIRLALGSAGVLDFTELLFADLLQLTRPANVGSQGLVRVMAKSYFRFQPGKRGIPRPGEETSPGLLRARSAGKIIGFVLKGRHCKG